MQTQLDLSFVRARFPALARTIDGRTALFADAPGGTQVPDSVVEAIGSYLRTSNANTGGAFAGSRETDELILQARRAGADLLGCRPDEVAFGPNMTTLNFALSRALGRDLGAGDEVVLTVLDHDANVAPWLAVAEAAGATVRWVDLRDADCTMDLDSLEASLSPRTKIVAITLASNAVGTVPPAQEVVRLIRAGAPGAVIVADGVHVAQHRSIDLAALGADVVFCSAYKVFGPHLGLMAARRDLLAAWRPFKVRPAPDEVPDRWETGTLNHEGLAGFVAAVEYLTDLGRTVLPRSGGSPPGRRSALVVAMGAIHAHEAALSARFLAGAANVQGLRLYGIADPDRVHERTPTFALRIHGFTPREVAERLAEQGIFVWDGNYYALAVMERLGLEESGGAVRVGFCHYNTVDEVDRVVEALSALGRSAGRSSP